LKKLAQGTLAILAIAGLVAVGVTGPAAAESLSTAQAAKKKKCGKKGKKGAVAAKKCKKKKKGGGATGPQIRLGEYACSSAGFIASKFQALPGNRYEVNDEDPAGTYTYNPANGIVTFKGGGFGSFYGVYSETKAIAPTVDIYANYNDPPIQVGDYYGECGWLSSNTS